MLVLLRGSFFFTMEFFLLIYLFFSVCFGVLYRILGKAKSLDVVSTVFLLFHPRVRSTGNVKIIMCVCFPLSEESWEERRPGSCCFWSFISSSLEASQLQIHTDVLACINSFSLWQVFHGILGEVQIWILFCICFSLSFLEAG